MNFKDSLFQIEPTDYCNLKCVMCMPQKEKREIHGNKHKGYLNIQLFKRILESIRTHDMYFGTALMHWIGEPFLHKDYLIMLKCILACESNFGIIRCDTNFNMVTKEMIDQLLGIATKKLHITLSLDATAAEVYSHIRVGGDFDRVISNIIYLIDQRRLRKSRGPTLNFQFVVQDLNHHQTEKFVSFWSQYLSINAEGFGDMISLMRQSVGTGGPQQDRADRLYDEVIGKLNIKDTVNGIKVCTMSETSWGEDG
ncbi:MAG: radical SAM protein [archaeon]